MAKKVKTVETEKAPTGIIINQITVNRVNRQILDIRKWRTALQSADMDRMTLLYDLYDDILLDGRLWDAIDRRIRAVTGADLTFQFQDGTESDELIDLIDTDEFEFLLHEVMQSVFWGASLLQLDFTNELETFSVPRKHIRPKTKMVAVMQNDLDGSIPYESIPNVIEVVNKKDRMGLILRAAPYVIMLRGGIGDWAQMVELFGMPQRVGKYSIYDQEARKQLEQAFKEQGAAASMVVPKETNVETTSSAGSVNSSIYKDFIAELKEAMLVTILSNTMTTLNGSSRSQGEVHQDVEDEVNKADLRFVQRVLNKKLKPILEARGFKVNGGSFVFPKGLKDLSVDELVKLSEIIEIPAYYFNDKYGLPVPAKGDIIAGKPITPKGEQDTPPLPKEEPQTSKGEKKEKQVKLSDSPSGVRGGFWESFFDFFADARTMGSRAFNLNLADKSTSSTADIAATTGIDINKLIAQAIREVYDNKEAQPIVSKSLFQSNFKPLEIAIKQQLNDVDDSEFISQFRKNAAVFSAFKAHLHGKAIADLLVDENGKLKPFYKFKKEALQISKKWKESWLQTEYQMAVRQARLAANLKEWEKNLDVYPNLEYIETTAAEPNHDHLTYVGTVLPFHHEWWKTHIPPSRWGCQCSVRPTRKAVTAVPDGDFNDPAFANSVLETASFVDIKETAFYNNTDEQLRDAVEKEAIRLAKEVLKEERAETLKKVMNLKGKEVTNKQTKAVIGFTVKGLKEAINNPFNDYSAKLEFIKQINKEMKTAEYIGAVNNIKTGKKPHIIRYHYYKAEIGGQQAVIVVSEDKFGKQTFYSISEKRKTTE